MMDKLANCILAAIATLVLLPTAAILGYWSQDTMPPTMFRDIEVLTPVVRPGDRFMVRIVVHRRRNDCSLHTDRVFFDGINARQPLDPEDFGAQPGDAEAEPIIEQFLVPAWAHTGTGRFRMVRSYFCNPLQHLLNEPIIVRMPDIEFQIVRPQSSPGSH